MLRRSLRHEEIFREEDWRFLFGNRKEEVLRVKFWLKVGLAMVICFLIGLAGYFTLVPYGFEWYGAVSLLTVAGIAVLAPKVLRYGQRGVPYGGRRKDDIKRPHF